MCCDKEVEDFVNNLKKTSDLFYLMFLFFNLLFYCYIALNTQKQIAVINDGSKAN